MTACRANDPIANALNKARRVQEQAGGYPGNKPAPRICAIARRRLNSLEDALLESEMHAAHGGAAPESNNLGVAQATDFEAGRVRIFNLRALAYRAVRLEGCRW